MREAWRAAWRNPDGTEKRTPMPALLLLLMLSGVMVPLFLFGNSEDLARSASTTGVQSAGGETVRSYSGRGSNETCRDAPVEFEADGERISSTTPVSGECVPAGGTDTVTVRYDPDNPCDFTTLPRQWILYGFAGAAALGFLVALVATLRRLRAHLARRRDAAVV